MIHFMSDLKDRSSYTEHIYSQSDQTQPSLSDNQCIEQSKLYGMRLASGKGPAVLSRSHMHKAFEGSGKVTLVGKPSRRSDRGQRNIGRTELVAGVLDAKLANVLSDSTTTKPAESAGQINRMYAD